jgi:hypothetical protein
MRVTKRVFHSAWENCNMRKIKALHNLAEWSRRTSTGSNLSMNERLFIGTFGKGSGGKGEQGVRLGWCSCA